MFSVECHVLRPEEERSLKVTAKMCPCMGRLGEPVTVTVYYGTGFTYEELIADASAEVALAYYEKNNELGMVTSILIEADS